METDRNVVLTGMPAAGKSTVGVILAKRLGYGFVDTDLVIQVAEGETLQAILEREGTARFRGIEERHVLALDRRAHVIATGGSVVYSGAAMAHLAAHGEVVFLDIGLEPLKKRLVDIRARGVVIEPGQTVDELYASRRPLYVRHARHTVDCGGLTPAEVVEAVLARLESG